MPAGALLLKEAKPEGNAQPLPLTGRLPVAQPACD